MILAKKFKGQSIKSGLEAPEKGLQGYLKEIDDPIAQFIWICYVRTATTGFVIKFYLNSKPAIQVLRTAIQILIRVSSLQAYSDKAKSEVK